MLLVIVVAAVLRFWRLGDVPPGLYRDEAQNGLDAVAVLSDQRQGESPFYFAANRGREPLYIYLSAASISLLGQSTLAVRVAAAIVGTLTTGLTYVLAKNWFDQRVGLLTAALWAITLWPMHLSRIGLRPILLPFMMVLTFLLGTLAYRRQAGNQSSAWLWLLSGLVYGGSYYTYLAVRFTPLLLLLLAIYLVLTGRRRQLWPGAGWFGLGTVVVVAPLAILTIQEPNLVLGRLDQVSVLNPAINEGNVLGALWRHGWQALGLFFVNGDSIIRHNPAGRPAFDLFMLVPFLIGLVWCLRNWRRPPAMALLLWIGIMLGPTILAEDTPHFLRAVGILPAAAMVPALGLSQLWRWSKLPSRLGQVLVIFLLFASLVLTVKDYFFEYGRATTTATWFEAAARELAEQINNDADQRDVFLDRRYWDGWPSVRFLVDSTGRREFYRPGELGSAQIGQPAVIYAWPYESLDAVTRAISVPAMVSGQAGSLAQGDLEPEPYPLYIRYDVDKATTWPVLANFDNTIQLRHAETTLLGDEQLGVDLYWSTEGSLEQSLKTFVHVEGSNGLLGQSDDVPSEGNWPSHFWRPGLIVHDRHVIELKDANSEKLQKILIGVYDAQSGKRLAVVSSDGEPASTTWLLQR